MVAFAIMLGATGFRCRDPCLVNTPEKLPYITSSPSEIELVEVKEPKS